MLPSCREQPCVRRPYHLLVLRMFLSTVSVVDQLQAWISEFVRRAWDVLNNGVSNSTQEQQIGVTTSLFQYLCDPAHSCLPHDLTQQLDAPPPAGFKC